MTTVLPGSDGERAGRSRPRRPALWGTLAVGILGALVGGVVRGPETLVSGVIATLLVVAFFSSGIVPLLLADGPAGTRRSALVLLMLTYVLRLALVLLVLELALRAGFVDPRWLGVTLIGCTLVWSALALAVVIRAART